MKQKVGAVCEQIEHWCELLNVNGGVFCLFSWSSFPLGAEVRLLS